MQITQLAPGYLDCRPNNWQGLYPTRGCLDHLWYLLLVVGTQRTKARTQALELGALE